MLKEFLVDLFDSGRVRVPSPDVANVDEITSVKDILKSAEEQWRLSLPSPQPEFDPNVAFWAAQQVYRAAQCLIHRETDVDTIHRLLQRRRQAPRSPSQHYSADLCLRFMNDILRLSKVASEEDPLNQQILKFMSDWPLSAVGLKCETHSAEILQHDSLRLMYLDRVIQRNDRNAMADRGTANALRALAGVHSDLLPAGLAAG